MQVGACHARPIFNCAARMCFEQGPRVPQVTLFLAMPLYIKNFILRNRNGLLRVLMSSGCNPLQVGIESRPYSFFSLTSPCNRVQHSSYWYELKFINSHLKGNEPNEDSLWQYVSSIYVLMSDVLWYIWLITLWLTFESLLFGNLMNFCNMINSSQVPQLFQWTHVI